MSWWLIIICNRSFIWNSWCESSTPKTLWTVPLICRFTFFSLSVLVVAHGTRTVPLTLLDAHSVTHTHTHRDRVGVTAPDRGQRWRCLWFCRWTHVKGVLSLLWVWHKHRTQQLLLSLEHQLSTVNHSATKAQEFLNLRFETPNVSQRRTHWCVPGRFQVQFEVSFSWSLVTTYFLWFVFTLDVWRRQLFFQRPVCLLGLFGSWRENKQHIKNCLEIYRKEWLKHHLVDKNSSWFTANTRSNRTFALSHALI